MLPQKRRVSRTEFETVLKNGGWYHSPHLTLRASKNTLGKKSVFAVSVSKKVAKKAVSRNLLKRRVYSVIGEGLSGVTDGYSAVFFLKKGIAEIVFSDLKKEVISLLQKAKILS